MQQQIAVIALGVTSLSASRPFYDDGFGWKAVFANDEIVFYQMNGLMLGLYLREEMEADVTRPLGTGTGAVALAHNVPQQEDVAPLIERLVAAGGEVMRPADPSPYGGFRGYVADPDGHLWEIAWNPYWTIDEAGHVTFGV